MPKRLIAITTDSLRLVVADSEAQKYAALSYTWGGPQPFAATNASVGSLMHGFRVEDLPNTLRDAVKLTQRLGLSYLWVDALCIIQDNDIDKAIEISRMGSIYENAAVTIASTRTKGVSESFLSRRVNFHGLSIDDDEIFGFHYRCRDGQRGRIFLMHAYRPNRDQDMLDTRGWSFQERLLSPRVVDYRTEQTKWMCRTSHGQTGFTDGWFDRRSAYRDHELLMSSQETIRSSDLPSSRIVRNARYQWYSILELFTSRGLTRGADRLPAISAVAQRYAKVLQADYIAGLWKPWIGEELLWKQREKITAAVRPKEYQGPSWSWAGISAAIEIKLLSTSERWAALSTTGPISTPHMGDFQIVDFSIDPLVEGAEYGELQPAKLTIRGKLRPARLYSTWDTIRISSLSRTLETPRQASTSWWSRILNGPPSTLETLALDVYLDCAEDDFRKFGHIREFPWQNDMDVILLSIGHYDKTHCGLILVQLSSGDYFRVGVFFSSSYRDRDAFPKDSDDQWEAKKREQMSWLFSGDRQTITLQ
jgi:Heterokaryon incompatibility protein (HET)